MRVLLQIRPLRNSDRYPFFVCAYFLHFSFNFFMYYHNSSLSSNPFFSTIHPLIVTDTPFLVAPKMHPSVHFLIQICHLEPQKCHFHYFSVCLSHWAPFPSHFTHSFRLRLLSPSSFDLHSTGQSMTAIDIDHRLAFPPFSLWIPPVISTTLFTSLSLPFHVFPHQFLSRRKSWMWFSLRYHPHRPIGVAMRFNLRYHHPHGLIRVTMLLDPSFLIRNHPQGGLPIVALMLTGNLLPPALLLCHLPRRTAPTTTVNTPWSLTR
jgi:hypothetical protein